MALAALPLQLPAGPFPPERVHDPGGKNSWLVSLAGPTANLAAAAATYGAFLLEPLPALRIVAQLHLLIAAYALLPVQPLDGYRIAASHPALAAILALLVSVASTALLVGAA